MARTVGANPSGRACPDSRAREALGLSESHEGPITPTATTGELKIDAKAGEVVVLWAGVTGGGWGILTVDRFETQAVATACIDAASYAVVVD